MLAHLAPPHLAESVVDEVVKSLAVGLPVIPGGWYFDKIKVVFCHNNTYLY